VGTERPNLIDMFGEVPPVPLQDLGDDKDVIGLGRILHPVVQEMG
jgi:hypothetical protein